MDSITFGAKVGLMDVWSNNRLLKEVCENRVHIDTAQEVEFVDGFVRPEDLEDVATRRQLEDFDFDFDSYEGLCPQCIQAGGNRYWLVGRYIVARIAEMDSPFGFIPESFHAHDYKSPQLAKLAFDKLQTAAPVITELSRQESDND